VKNVDENLVGHIFFCNDQVPKYGGFNMRSNSFLLLTRTVLCSLLIIAFIGCEDDSADIPDSNSLEGADRGDLTGPADPEVIIADLTLSPESTELEGDGGMASFTASGGVPPYKWSVQDVFRGSVVDSGGAGAVYQRSAAGDNSVIVEDSQKPPQKTFAVIMQP
jgi:hypothetical protein